MLCEARSAWDIFARLQAGKHGDAAADGTRPRHISTGCAQFDHTFFPADNPAAHHFGTDSTRDNGQPPLPAPPQAVPAGLPLGQLTELCGVPGIGKTCLVLQSLVNAVAMNRQNAAIYIDCSSGFSIDRLVQIIKAQTFLPPLNLMEILARIFVFRVVDAYDLRSVLHTTPDFIHDQCKKAKLQVVIMAIDSVAMPLRLFPAWVQLPQRIKTVRRVGLQLRWMARSLDIAIVTVNQMTTRFDANPMVSRSIARLVPSMGDNWTFYIHRRICLFWKAGTRYACLMDAKGPVLPFKIKESGIECLL